MGPSHGLVEGYFKGSGEGHFESERMRELAWDEAGWRRTSRPGTAGRSTAANIPAKGSSCQVETHQRASNTKVRLQKFLKSTP